MSESLQLIVCAFDAATRMDDVTRALKALDQRLHVVQLGNIAIVHKDASGQIAVHESQDPRESISNVASALAGSVAWFLYAFAGLFGPLAQTYTQARVSEAMHLLVRDMGFPDDVLFQIGRQLDAGQSALITLVRSQDREQVVEQLQHLGGTIIEHPLSAEQTQRLLTAS